MKISKYIALAFAASLLSLGACSDDDKISFPEGQGIVIEAPQASDMGSTYMTLSTVFHMKSDAHYTKAGYVVGDNPNPTIYGKVYEGKVEGDRITATLVDLAPDHEYHVRAFMSEYNGAVVYSEDFTIHTSDGSLADQLAHYKGPQYPDEYSGISSWENRNQWNLANVHDPSVVKAADGYYYMYQTDASYGNAHTQEVTSMADVPPTLSTGNISAEQCRLFRNGLCRSSTKSALQWGLRLQLPTRTPSDIGHQAW